MIDMTNAIKKLSLNYSFSPKELATLARIFRTHQDKIPEELIDFSLAIEREIYNNLSIEEAQIFYS